MPSFVQVFARPSVAGMETVVIMSDGRGRLVLVVMGMAVMVVRMAAMGARDQRDLRRAEGIGDGRAKPEHRQREQEDQQGPDARDSIRIIPSCITARTRRGKGKSTVQV